MKYPKEAILFNLSDDAHDFPDRREAIGELFGTLAVGAFHQGNKPLQAIMDELLKRLEKEEDYTDD